MIFADIITLAKAGFTPADIREFMAAPTPEVNFPDKTEDPEAKTPDPEPETQKEDIGAPPEPGKEKPAEAGGSEDYKTKYEETLKALKAAQADNTRQQIPPDKTDEEIFSEALINLI